MTEPLDENLTTRFEAALRAGDFRPLVTEFQAEGRSQVAIYVLFDEFLSHLRTEQREQDEDTVLDAMDFIWGWCNRDSMWFDQTLTSKEVEEFRRTRI